MGLRAGNGHQREKACLCFLDFGLDVVDGIGRLDLEGEGDGLASEATGQGDGGTKKASICRSKTRSTTL